MDIPERYSQADALRYRAYAAPSLIGSAIRFAEAAGAGFRSGRRTRESRGFSRAQRVWDRARMRSRVIARSNLRSRATHGDGNNRFLLALKRRRLGDLNDQTIRGDERGARRSSSRSQTANFARARGEERRIREITARSRAALPKLARSPQRV